MAHITPIVSNTTEMNYKSLAQRYITPDKAHKYQREASQLCWSGCKELGTKTHIGWTFPKIKIYWREVLQIIKDITNVAIGEDPWRVPVPPD